MRGTRGLTVVIWGAAALSACGHEALTLAPSWEEFVANPPLTLGEYLASSQVRADARGGFVVEGDVAVADREAVRPFYDVWLQREYRAQTPGEAALSVAWANNDRVIWRGPQRDDLTYCVSDSFGQYKDLVVRTMNNAAWSWAANIPVQFRYVREADAACNASNPNVLFRVVPGAGVGNLAFYPDAPPALRELQIAPYWLTLPAHDHFDRHLRHDVGHILGFGHEPGTCTDPMDRTVENLIRDGGSIMYAPCGGVQLPRYQSLDDLRYAAIVYGSAPTSTVRFGHLFPDTFAGPPQYYETIEYPDIDGDGRSDICGLTTTGMLCETAAGARVTALVSGYPQPSLVSSRSQWETIRYVDVTGDGKADLCGRTTDGVWCSVSQGTSFAPATRWSELFSDENGWGASEHRWRTIRFPDVNGDGKADVCGRGAAGIMCQLSAGSGFGPYYLWTNAFGDGDGWQYDPAYWQTIEYPDLNGDGNDDVCGRGYWGILCALSNTQTFSTPTYWTTQFSDGQGWAASPRYWKTLRFGDLNGDGKDDLCGRGGAAMYCMLSSGSTFLPWSFWSREFSDALGWGTSPRYYETMALVDIDGDGKADVCGRSENGLLCGSSDGAKFSWPRILVADFNDISYGHDTRWPTIGYVDRNGDGRREACGRGSVGVRCSKP